MKSRQKFFFSFFVLFALLMLAAAVGVEAQETAQDSPEMAALGKALFFDKNLSANATQSCATCHGPEVGFTGPDSGINAAGSVYPGALPGRFGNRKPPTSAYGGYSPELHFDEDDGGWFGGMFWDGRASGWALHDALAEQAQGPYLNPLEQAIPNAKMLCIEVKRSAYAPLFLQVWGPKSLDCLKDANGVYERIGRSVAAYERSDEVNPYTSKFDLFWDAAIAAGKDPAQIKCGSGGMGGGGGGMGGGGMGGAMGCPSGGADPNRWSVFRNLGLSDNELIGLAVFNDRADCASCHSLEPGPAGYPLFTDYGYDNVGLPRNPENPFYTANRRWNPDGANWVDYGLGQFLKNAGYAPEVYEPELGKFKVPTLRNVARRPGEDTVKAYGHNGYFKSLDDIVFFYHWRAMMDACMSGGMGGGMGGGMCAGMADMFPSPEVEQNRAAMAMFPRPQVENIVLFLETLSDGYFER